MAIADSHPEPNSGQRLLRGVFGYSWNDVPNKKPSVDDYAVDEVAVWQFIDVELSEREALVLKYLFGQDGRCHTLNEIAPILPRADGAGIGVTRERIRQIERRALRILRHPTRSRTLLRLAQGGPTKPLDASSQKLLREVFSHEQCGPEFPFWPWADDHAVDGVAVWKFIDEVLSEEEAFVLKYRFGQVGRCHTVKEIARILPSAYGGRIGATSELVRNIEESALGKLGWEPIAQSLWDLAMGRKSMEELEAVIQELSLVRADEDEIVEVEAEDEDESTAEKTLTCSDCGSIFPFSASEREFCVSIGFVNIEPRYCASCRQSMMGKRHVPDTGRPEMFAVVCPQCGKEAQVPFEARPDRPVFCILCYNSWRRAWFND